MVAGIDVGARRLHVVLLSQTAELEGSVFAATDLDSVANAVADARVIAIDAPQRPSNLPHACCVNLSPKFRRARCAEIALGREHGIWVPWVSPASRPADPWIEVGFDLFERLSPRSVEVYPHASFRILAGGRRLPKKTSPAGAAARIELLRSAGVAAARGFETWSHDLLDAAVAAVTARDVADGSARRVSCGHDDSAIWLPA
jgi:predicted nuclease with RNAse H fold